MDTIYWIYSAMSILAIPCIFVGFWVAARFLPALINWIQPKVNHDLISHPSVKFILWLALGGLFSLPLLDFVRGLGYLANIVFLAGGPADNGFSTFLGLAPSWAYYGFNFILVLVIFGIVIWFCSDFLSTGRQFNRAERTFIIFSIASLFYHGVSNIFTYIFTFQLPAGFIQQNYGIGGFILEVAIGFVILSLILLGVNLFLPFHPAGRMQTKQ